VGSVTNGGLTHSTTYSRLCIMTDIFNGKCHKHPKLQVSETVLACSEFQKNKL
jgi:hypothetical protein